MPIPVGRENVILRAQSGADLTLLAPADPTPGSQNVVVLRPQSAENLVLTPPYAPPSAFAGLESRLFAGLLKPEVAVVLTGHQLTVSQGTPIAESLFAFDSFTDTNNTAITSHVSDSGHSWTMKIDASGGANLPFISSNRLVGWSFGSEEAMVLDADGPLSEYVTARFRVLDPVRSNSPDTLTRAHFAVGCRGDSGMNGYFFGFDAAAGVLKLYALSSAGQYHVLASDASFTYFNPGVNDEFDFTISAENINANVDVNVKAYIDGVLIFDEVHLDVDSGDFNGLHFWTDPAIILDNGAESGAVANVDWIKAGVLVVDDGSESVTPTGLSVTASRGTLVPALDVALTGAAATGAGGTLVPALAVTLTGQVVTVQQGTLTPVMGAGAVLTGQAATAQAGTLTPRIDVALVGAAATTVQGSMAVALARALTGLAATASPGTLTSQVAVTLVGASMTAQRGTMLVSMGVTLSGQAASAQQGAFVPSITIALVGGEVDALLGVLGASQIIVPEVVMEVIHLFTQMAEITLTASYTPTQDLFSQSTTTSESTASIESSEDSVLL